MLTRAGDVSALDEVETLRDVAFAERGGVHCLMNNAGMATRVKAHWEHQPEVKKTREVNLRA